MGAGIVTQGILLATLIWRMSEIPSPLEPLFLIGLGAMMFAVTRAEQRISQRIGKIEKEIEALRAGQSGQGVSDSGAALAHE
jgi:hypothetical protein